MAIWQFISVDKFGASAIVRSETDVVNVGLAPDHKSSGGSTDG